jgi:hypothetical protein
MTSKPQDKSHTVKIGDLVRYTDRRHNLTGVVTSVHSEGCFVQFPDRASPTPVRHDAVDYKVSVIGSNPTVAAAVKLAYHWEVKLSQIAATRRPTEAETAEANKVWAACDAAIRSCCDSVK